MAFFVQFLLLGIGTGAIYGLAAQGIVLVYRGSGILNFSHGAVALVAAEVFASSQPTLGTVGASILGVLAGAGLGGLIQLLLMRPLNSASPLVKVISTLGLLTVVQQGAVQIFGNDPRFLSPTLPNRPVHIATHIVVPEQDFWLFGIAVAVSTGLWAVYRFTQFGRQTVAVAEDDVNAAGLGCSPRRVALINWCAGSGLAGLSGVLLAPLTNVDPTSLTLLVIPALAAALVGGFRSFPLTLLGGVLLGSTQTELQHYVSNPGWPSTAPFLIVVILMIARGQTIPLRSHLFERLPRIGSGQVRVPIVLGTAALAAALIWTVQTEFADAMTTSLALAIVVLSIIVVTGYCGQLSLAQLTVGGIGALFATRMADAWHMPFILALVLGVAATVPVGLILAIPAIRTRGATLAIATLSMAVAAQSLILGNPSFTGGPIRGTVLPTVKLFGWHIDSVNFPRRYATVALVAFILCALVVANLRRGRSGRRLLAVRANERAAASLGVGVIGAKIYAFGLAAGLAAVGGILMGFRFTNVDFSGYDVLGSILAVEYAVIGGIGMVGGSALGGSAGSGGVAQWVVNHWISVNNWVPLIGGILFLITIILQPDGSARKIADQLAPLFQRLQRNRAAKASIEAQTPDRPRRVLRLDNISASFGGVQALDNVSLEVNSGEVVGLIGPNGAGKTTLIDAASGLLRSYRGQVWLDEACIDRRDAKARSRSGIGRSFQSLELFEDMTVLDNLRVASDSNDIWAYVTDLVRPKRQRLNNSALSAIRAFDLENDLDKYPSELPFGRRHLVGLARAVACSPSILLLDEPFAGLDETERMEIGSLIRRIAVDWGIGVLLVEHDVELVMRTCDRIVALDAGKPLAAGTPTEIRRNPLVIASYLGVDVDELTAVGEVAL